MRQQNQRLTPEEKDALKGRIFDQLGVKQPEAGTSGSSLRRVHAGYRWGIAAAILFVVSVPLYLLVTKNTTGHSSPAFARTIVKTGSGETRQVILPDSSVVLLNAGSVLTWSAGFLTDSGREVTLQGNAFFNVKKMADHRRFTVNTRSLAVAVLGTEFNVNARTGAAEVALVRGKVNVSRAGGGLTEVLSPGEQVRFDSAGSRLVRSKINAALYSAWTGNKWNFSHTRLEEILALVQAYYGVNTVFKSERTKDLKITASITVGSLDDLVAVIENTLQIRIKLEKNQLLVQ